MGDNKKFYIVIFVLLGLIVLQFWNPFKKRATESDFNQTMDSLRQTLADYSAQNAVLKAQTDSLRTARFGLDSIYEQQMAINRVALAQLNTQLEAAKRTGNALLGSLNALKGQLAKSGAPDSIPTLNNLRDQKYPNR